MKIGWERSHEMVVPDIHTITKVLKPFLKERIITEVQPLNGGLNNSNIKITTNTGENFVLRIYGENDNKIYIERNILDLLQKKVPVPQVLYFDTFRSEFNYPFVLLSWVHGQPLSEIINGNSKKQVASTANELGKYLAHIHKIKFPHSGFFDEKLAIKEPINFNEDMFMMLVEEMLVEGYGGIHLGSEVCDNVLNFSRKHAHLLNDLGEQNSLVHSDFNPLNILVDEQDSNTNITAILDWEYAFSGSALTDIGNMLRYEDIRTSELLEPFTRSYEVNGGTLPEKWLQKAKLLDLIALCDLLNKEECGEVRLVDIKGLILKMMDEWEEYAVVQGGLHKYG